MSAEVRALGVTAARGAGVTVAGQAYSFVLQTASVVVLARLILPGDFGLIAMVVAVIGVSELIRDFGLSAAAIRAEHVTDAERDNLFWLNTALGVAVTGVVIAAAPLIGLMYDDPRVPSVVMVLAPSFALSGMATQYRADLTRRLKFTALTVTRVVSPTVALLVALVLALMGTEYWALAAQRLVNLLLFLLLSALAARWIPGLPHRHTSIRKFIRFGAALFGTKLLSYATSNVDSVAIGMAWGSVPLGYYDRAFRLLVTPLTQINAPMMQVALPTLSRVHENKPTLEHYVLKAQVVVGYGMATLFALAAGLSPSLILLLLGPEWSPVVPIFMVLAIGGVFRATEQIAFWLFLAVDRAGAQLKMSMLMSPLMIVCILAGLPWGAVGVAGGSAVAYCLQWVVALMWSARAAAIDPRRVLVNILRIVIVVNVPCGLIGWAVGLLGWSAIGTVVAGLLGSLVYLGAMYLLVPSVHRDLRFVLRFALQAIGRRGR